MKRGGAVLWLAGLLTACAPTTQRQPVQVWEGSATVLLRKQDYRLTFTVNPTTYQLNGTLENRSSRDRFAVSGTLLPVEGGAELTAQVSAGGGARLGASILGLGVGNVALKSDALLTGHAAGTVLTGTLRVNGVAYPLELRQVRSGRP